MMQCPDFFGVAQLGPGIPDGPGHPRSSLVSS